MSDRTTMRDYVNSGQHLPAPLRDFHDQKDVFKSLHEWIGKPVALMHAGLIVQDLERDGCDPALVERVREALRVSWVDGQCYVIDYVLRFLAAHGWTLQRSRARVAFADLDDTIRERRDREADMLKQAFASSRATPATTRPPGQEQNA